MVWPLLVVSIPASPSPHVVVWKSKTTFPPDAAESLRSWEPLPLQVADDRDCQSMASYHQCDGYNRPDLLNIMRADACRYMALYRHGGIYTDLDVDLKRPFIGQCKGLCVGKEYTDKNILANYAFMAPQYDLCLLRAIRSCCDNLRNVSIDFRADPHLVHNTCGPTAFTKAVSSCVYRIWPNKIFSRHVNHQTASTKWRDYPSWVKERQNRVGWKTVYEDGKKPITWFDRLRRLFF